MTGLGPSSPCSRTRPSPTSSSTATRTSSSSAAACSSRCRRCSRTRRISCASSRRSSPRSAGASTNRARFATRACSTARASTAPCGRSASTARWSRSASSRSRSSRSTSSSRSAPSAADGRAARRGRQGAHHHDRLGRHGLRQDDDAQRPVGLHLAHRAPDHDRGRGRAAVAAAARRAHGDAPAEHRGQGRDPPARPRQERAAHAPRAHHPRRVPRRGSLRHAPGHEHRPRGLDGDDPRQQPARGDLAPRADDRHGRPAHEPDLDPRPDRRGGAHGRAAAAPRDGKRRVTSVAEITGMEGDIIQMQEIFKYVRTGTDADGTIQGHQSPTGVRRASCRS